MSDIWTYLSQPTTIMILFKHNTWLISAGSPLPAINIWWQWPLKSQIWNKTKSDKSTETTCMELLLQEYIFRNLFKTQCTMTQHEKAGLTFSSPLVIRSWWKITVNTVSTVLQSLRRKLVALKACKQSLYLRGIVRSQARKALALAFSRGSIYSPLIKKSLLTHNRTTSVDNEIS